MSNSSSSSFIVAWDEEVKTIEDVKKHMSFATTKQIEVVFNDMQQQEPFILIPGNFDFDFDSVLKRIITEVSNMVNSGFFPGKDYGFPENREEWDLFEEKNKERALEIAHQFLKEAQGKVIYHFTYADEDGEFWSSMEHGDLFRNLQQLRISHH